MSIGSRIKERRESLGLTQTQLAAALGVTKGAIGNYETDANSPKASILYKVFDILKCDANYLFQDEIRERREYTASPAEMEHIKKYRSLDGHGKETVDIIMEREILRIAQVKQEIERIEEEQDNIIYLAFNNQKASAGTGFALVEEYMEKRAVLYNDLTRRADFCVCVDGDSMEPIYHDGDIVLVRQQPSVDIGEIGLYIMDGKGYIKRQGNGIIESLNPDYDDIAPLGFEDIICKGKVLGRLEPGWLR